MRTLLAIFMVVLIGNPVCCCAFVPLHAESDVAKTDLPPCCQARLAAESDPDDTGGTEEPSPKCPCAAKLGFLTADKVFAPAPLPVRWVPAIPVGTEVSAWLRGPRRSPGAGPAPGALVAVPAPPPRILYGVFRC